jgi:hypothetical protein
MFELIVICFPFLLIIVFISLPVYWLYLRRKYAMSKREMERKIWDMSSENHVLPNGLRTDGVLEDLLH